MPTYDYDCQKCGTYEAFRSISQYDGKDACPDCGTIGKRVFVRNGMFMGAAVQSAEYNPGLGCVTKNKEHREEICRRRGLVEIGNENPRKTFEAERKKKAEKPYLTGEQLYQIKDSMR